MNFWTILAALLSIVAGVTSVILARHNPTLVIVPSAVVIIASLGTIAISLRARLSRPVALVKLQERDGSHDGSPPNPPTDTPNPEPFDGRSAPPDGKWLGLVEEVVLLLDEMERAQTTLAPNARELAEHVESRLGEILIRTGVQSINDESTFDRLRHQPLPGRSAKHGTAVIAETIRPGLIVGRRVLRRAVVRLADGGSDT